MSLAAPLLLAYVLAAILVIGAVGGSFLKPRMRARIERFVLLPLWVLIALAAVILAVVAHQWWQAILLAVVSSLRAVLPRRRDESQITHPGGGA